MLYTNADQFLNKRDDLCMSIAGNEPDVICVTEVIPKAQTLPISPAQLAIPGYSQYTNFDHSSPCLGASGKRGICLFIASNLKATEITFPGNPFSEQLWLKLRLHGGDALVLGAIYRSPSSDTLSTSHLCQLLVEVTNTKPSHLLIMGDFNFSTIDWNCCMSTAPLTHPSHMFLDAVLDSYLVQHVKQPTRFRLGDTPHTLDLILTNEEGMIANLSHLPALGSSDHEVLRFDLLCYNSRTECHDSKLNLNRGDYEAMAKDLDSVPWEIVELEPLEEHYKFFCG